MEIPLCVICCFSLAAFNICSFCLIFVNLINMCLGVTVNFQIFKLVLEKPEEPEIKLSTSTGSWKKTSVEE